MNTISASIIDAQPLIYLDQHGYVSGLTDEGELGHGLVEPTTPPHGGAYEYDLFIQHAYPHGTLQEAEVLRRASQGDLPAWEPEATQVIMPFRDWASGWDDWPPIFGPQFAAYHGVVASTIEFPFRINADAGPAPDGYVESNIEFVRATIDGSLLFAHAHHAERLADQTEVFRRGDEFDVIHSHLESFGFEPARNSRTPVVTTLHLRVDAGETAARLRHHRATRAT
jgi:hypothetical protein